MTSFALLKALLFSKFLISLWQLWRPLTIKMGRGGEVAPLLLPLDTRNPTPDPVTLLFDDEL